jgi:hypothetical protein
MNPTDVIRKRHLAREREESAKKRQRLDTGDAVDEPPRDIKDATTPLWRCETGRERERERLASNWLICSCCTRMPYEQQLLTKKKNRMYHHVMSCNASLVANAANVLSVDALISAQDFEEDYKAFIE